MANFIEVSTRGVKEFIGRLRRARAAAPNELRVANQGTLEDFVKIVTTYPSEVAGNRPPPPYWKRGAGRVINQAGTINPPSQQYGADGGHLNSWDITASTIPDGSIGRATTDVTYAPWVSQLQPRWHRGRWKSLTEAAEMLGLSVARITVTGVPERFRQAANNIVRIISR